MPSWYISGFERPRGPTAIGAGGPAAATEWNPSDVGSNVTVSNSGRTVTYSGSGNQNAGGRSIAAATSNQLVYIEHTVTTVAHSHQIGFANSDAILQEGATSSSPTKAFSIHIGGQFFDADSGDHATSAIASFTTGDRIGIAFNTATLKVWFRKNGGTWNSAIGGGAGQDPATGGGGLNVVLAATNYRAWFGWDADTAGGPDAMTTNFSSGSWTDTAPSGFSQLAA